MWLPVPVGRANGTPCCRTPRWSHYAIRDFRRMPKRIPGPCIRQSYSPADADEVMNDGSPRVV
eukprot:14524142-Heterocapsa_arctica.AAC.1